MPIRGELARAFQRYFSERGGSSMTPAREIVPVILFDDLSTGPYPAFTPWHAFTTRVVGTPGNNVIAEVINADPIGTKSVLVLDSLRYATANTDDILISVRPTLAFTGPTLANAQRRNVEVQTATGGATTPDLSNVQVGSTDVTGVLTAAVQYIFSSTTGHVENLGIILGPQQQCLFGPTKADNNSGFCLIGRYYPNP